MKLPHGHPLCDDELFILSSAPQANHAAGTENTTVGRWIKQLAKASE